MKLNCVLLVKFLQLQYNERLFQRPPTPKFIKCTQRFMISHYRNLNTPKLWNFTVFFFVKRVCLLPVNFCNARNVSTWKLGPSSEIRPRFLDLFMPLLTHLVMCRCCYTASKVIGFLKKKKTNARLFLENSWSTVRFCCWSGSQQECVWKPFYFSPFHYVQVHVCAYFETITKVHSLICTPFHHGNPTCKNSQSGQ